MTKQDVLDRLVKHFLVDKNPPGLSDTGVGCAYFNRSTGACCGVGVFLTTKTLEDFEARGMLGLAVRSIYDEAAELQVLPFVFWRDIQSAHDNALESEASGFHSGFEVALKLLSGTEGLEWREEWNRL